MYLKSGGIDKQLVQKSPYDWGSFQLENRQAAVWQRMQGDLHKGWRAGMVSSSALSRSAVQLLIPHNNSSDSFWKGLRVILGNHSVTKRGFCLPDSCHMHLSKRPSEHRKLLRNYPVVGAFSCCLLLTYICVWLTHSCHNFLICGVVG